MRDGLFLVLREPRPLGRKQIFKLWERMQRLNRRKPNARIHTVEIAPEPKYTSTMIVECWWGSIVMKPKQDP